MNYVGEKGGREGAIEEGKTEGGGEEKREVGGRGKV